MEIDCIPISKVKPFVAGRTDDEKLSRFKLSLSIRYSLRYRDRDSCGISTLSGERDE